MTDFRETPGTPEDVAALHQEATLVADGLRTLMWSYHYKGEERTYSGLIDRQRATIERLEQERDEAKAISQGWELQAGEAEAEVERLRIALCEIGWANRLTGEERTEIARAALSASAKTAEDRG